MYTNNRDAYRQFFFTVWQKHKKNLVLDATEARLAAIMEQHPEYHAMLEKADTTAQEYAPEENPFMHMSLHLALREQIDTNRPAGIGLIQQQLLNQYKDPLHVEHLMMECLCRMMGVAQQTGTTPSDEDYLQALEVIIKLRGNRII
jgi:hypothetical protein